MESGFCKVWTTPIVVFLLANGGTLLADPNDPFAPENRAQPRQAPPSIKEKSLGLKDLVNFQVSLQPPRARPGELVKLTVTGQVKKGYHTYPITKRTREQNKLQLSRLSYDLGNGLQALWPISETEPAIDRKKKETHHEGQFTWSQEVLVLPEAEPGPRQVKVKIRLMVCDDRGCVGPGNYPPLTTSLEVLPGPKATLSSELETRRRAPEPPIDIVGTSASDQKGLWGLLVSAAIGAFLMLLTPCVFPMVPITVNFFIKQSEHEHHNPLLMASVYCGTIIFLLTLVMLVLGTVVIDLANSALFNVALGAVLVFFALSLFGMYEIELPSFLVNFTSARESKGGMLGTVFMALTFTITSFTCTGPFIGAMLAPVAELRPERWHLVLAALVYSATFAAPFFFLALFPGLLRKLPKSGGWMNAIKVTMGFLELGAALKFLSNADLVWSPGNPRLFNYDTVLCAWIALSFACGLYLIGTFRLPHDDQVDHIGVIRMVFASFFFGLAVYMTPALRGEVPAGIVGESLVAFLPPSFKEKSDWHLDYKDAWEQARRENKLIFIDFTGVTCTNCRDNEKNVFPRPEVARELKQYVRVQLYTDSVPNPTLSAKEAEEQARRNSQWRDRLGDATNPYYIIFRPAHDAMLAEDDMLKGEKIDSRNGTIFDVADFVRFLQEPLQKQAAARTILPWHRDYVQAWSEAKSKKTLMFLNFTALTNTTCADNEKNIFTQPVVAQKLEKFTRVQLFLDWIPERPWNEMDSEAERNQRWRDQFPDNGYPTYIVFRPDRKNRLTGKGC